MAEPHSTGWQQLGLFEPDCFEVRMRIGVVPAGNHVQVLVEALDPRTKELFAMSSIPHHHLTNVWVAVAAGYAEVLRFLEEHLEPFPTGASDDAA